MYCPHCAAAVQPNQTFCSVCGQAVSQPGVPPVPQAQAPQPQGWQPQQPPSGQPQYQQAPAWQQQPQYQAQPIPGWPMQQPQFAAAQPMPPSVRLAGALLLAAMGVGILTTIYYYGRFFQSSGSFNLAFSFFQSVVFAVIWGVLVIFIWKGQNWARIAATVFIAYSVVMVLFSLTRVLSISGATNYLPSFAISLIAAGARAFAAFLLFQPEANAYFKNR